MTQLIENSQEIQISDRFNVLNSKVEEILKLFKVKYYNQEKRYTMPCPVHGGDNQAGCCIYLNDKVPRWICWTHSCQEHYGSTLFGFIKGLLSYEKDRKISNAEVFRFIEKFTGCKINNTVVCRDLQPHEKFLRILQMFSSNHSVQDISEEMPQLKIPSEYYIKRGYKPNVLYRYKVGDCLTKGLLMSWRAVVPIYDIEGRYIGCTGRSIYPGNKIKWMHSKGLKTGDILYGLNLAKNSIIKKREIIIVEGPGDVWKMYQAGFSNVVAILGSNLSEQQLIYIEESGAHDIIVLTDFDEPGEKAAKKIIEKCGRRFNYKRPKNSFNHKDVGDMSIKQIKELIK